MLVGINASYFLIDRGTAVIYSITFLFCKKVLVSAVQEKDCFNIYIYIYIYIHTQMYSFSGYFPLSVIMRY